MYAPARLSLAAGLLIALAGGSPLAAQVLHVNDTWDNCAIVLDPSLTQEAWHQFVGELGVVAYFRPLTSARPLGRRHLELSILDWGTRIDPADAAWNDTFSHPDSTHWLFDGDALLIPGLMARMGVTDRLDVGAYFTKSIGANYALLGGQVQYGLLHDAARDLDVAGRASTVWLLGPADLSASVYGLDVLVSKNLGIFSPYAGVSGLLSLGREHTSKVDLAPETILGIQGTVGVAASISALRLGAEANLARVSGYSFKVAFGT